MSVVEVPFQTVTLENVENIMPVVEAELNGHPIRLVVDTGASHTCLDKSMVKKYAAAELHSEHSPFGNSASSKDTVMGLGGRRLSHALYTLDTLSIGGLKLESYTVVAVRMSNINKMLKWVGQESIAGLLGCDVLQAHKACMDFERQVIRFQSDIH